MTTEIQARLLALSQPEYRKFSSGLIPGKDNILGVRLPALRALAKELARSEGWEAFLSCPAQYFEETMLQGMVIGCCPVPRERRLELVRSFVPKIDNWSVCDSFCAGLKDARKDRALYWSFLSPYFASHREYELRFAAVMALDHFVTEQYLGPVLGALDAAVCEGYYAKMGVAWAVSVCLAHFPRQTMEYLKACRLDDETYHMAVRKALESLRVSAEDKTALRAAGGRR